MTIERNLVIVHTQDFQDIADFQEIARTVRELAPDIEVFIASNTIPSSATRRRASRRPSLMLVVQSRSSSNSHVLRLPDCQFRNLLK
jgi:4-hydroxy-3-methylbut-2-enyl diphosphate reductase IspH